MTDHPVSWCSSEAGCDEHGTIAGFLGRARPGAGSGTPKYLNGPQTTRYVKGDLLFGLHEARRRLAAGAVPVIAEGPFDAIAVSTASMGEFAGLAPCGTALTVRQLAGLTCVIDLARTQILIALDGDRAGREAAIRAYRILVPVTDRAAVVLLPSGCDPAGILRAKVTQRRPSMMARSGSCWRDSRTRT